MDITAPPEGSKLSVRTRRSGTIEVRFGEPGRFGVRGLFLILLLPIWWAVWLFSLTVEIVMLVALLQGKEADTGGQTLGVIFVLAWLAGWGYGGMALARSLYRMRKGGEMLVLEPELACYRSGKAENEPPAWCYWRGGIRVARSMVGGFRVEDTSQGRRIALTVGSQRMFIGENLEGKDALWLHNLLVEWRQHA